MAKKKATVAGTKLKRGERMTKGKGWRLVGPGKKAFKASLAKMLDIGGESLAIFAFCLSLEKNKLGLKNDDFIGAPGKIRQRRKSDLEFSRIEITRAIGARGWPVGLKLTRGASGDVAARLTAD